MQFNFPSNTKLESLNLRIKVTTGNMIRAIARERNIPITEVYTTIIEEAIEEYRQIYPKRIKEFEKRKRIDPHESGKLGGLKTKELYGQEHFQEISSIGGKTTAMKYGKEYLSRIGKLGGKRSQETMNQSDINSNLKEKNTAAVELGRRGGLVGGNARAAKLSSEERSSIAQKAARNRWSKKKVQEIEIERLPKEWWKEENLKPANSDGEYLYCANGNCKKYKFGKFLKGMETLRDNKVFCSIICADEVFPIRQPLPDNFTYAYCQYLLCPKKKYIRDEGIEEGGKNFCSDKCYEYWLESIKSLSAVN